MFGVKRGLLIYGYKTSFFLSFFFFWFSFLFNLVLFLFSWCSKFEGRAKNKAGDRCILGRALLPSTVSSCNNSLFF